MSRSCNVLLLFSSYACCSLYADPFIIEKGKPGAEIVIAEEPLRPVKLAAKELQDYLRKMTGAELPVTTVPSEGVPVQIYVGKSSSTETLGISDKGLDHGAFRIVSGKNWLVLLGHDTNFTPIKPYAEYNADIPRMMEEWDKRTGEIREHKDRPQQTAPGKGELPVRRRLGPTPEPRERNHLGPCTVSQDNQTSMMLSMQQVCNRKLTIDAICGRCCQPYAGCAFHRRRVALPLYPGKNSHLNSSRTR